MIVLHYINEFDFSLGGVVEFVRSLTSELSNSKTQTLLLVGRNVDLPRDWMNVDEATPNAQVLSPQTGLQGWIRKKSKQQIKKAISVCDVIHLHGAWDFGNFQIAKIAGSLQKPYIASPHGMLDDLPLKQKRLKKALFLKLTAEQFFKNAAVVHCTAEGEADQVRSNIKGLNSIQCIPPITRLPSPDLNTQSINSQFPQLNQHVPRILFLGRIHQIKGLEHLLDAAAKLCRNGVGLQIVMAGPGETNYVGKLKAQADDLGIANHVAWLGPIHGSSKTELLRSCDIFALPTLHENFGIVLAEAALAGLPIVTTPFTNIYRELGSAGASIADPSGESFATHLKKLIEDPHRQKIGEGLQTFVRKWLEPSKVLHQYQALYHSVADGSYQPKNSG